MVSATEEMSDAVLLRRFVSEGDELAFEQLVSRHAGLVLGVCRRITRDEVSADDAFQAVMLTFFRRAHKIKEPAALSSWLYRVTVHAAVLVRRKQSGGTKPLHESAALVPGADEAAQRNELSALVDEAIEDLPEHYRRPIILCYLQQQPREDVSALLGWTAGKLHGVLERGREALRSSLARRGIGVTAGAMVAFLRVDAAPYPAAGGWLNANIAAVTSQKVSATAAGVAAKLQAGNAVLSLTSAALGAVVIAVVSVAAVSAMPPGKQDRPQPERTASAEPVPDAEVSAPEPAGSPRPDTDGARKSSAAHEPVDYRLEGVDGSLAEIMEVIPPKAQGNPYVNAFALQISYQLSAYAQALQLEAAASGVLPRTLPAGPPMPITWYVPVKPASGPPDAADIRQVLDAALHNGNQNDLITIQMLTQILKREGYEVPEPDAQAIVNHVPLEASEGPPEGR